MGMRVSGGRLLMSPTLRGDDDFIDDYAWLLKIVYRSIIAASTLIAWRRAPAARAACG